MVQIPAALDLAGPLSPASLGRGGAVDQHAAGLFDQSPGVPGHRHARVTGCGWLFGRQSRLADE